MQTCRTKAPITEAVTPGKRKAGEKTTTAAHAYVHAQDGVQIVRNCAVGCNHRRPRSTRHKTREFGAPDCISLVHRAMSGTSNGSGIEPPQRCAQDRRDRRSATPETGKSDHPNPGGDHACPALEPSANAICNSLARVVLPRKKNTDTKSVTSVKVTPAGVSETPSASPNIIFTPDALIPSGLNSYATGKCLNDRYSFHVSPDVRSAAPSDFIDLYLNWPDDTGQLIGQHGPPNLQDVSFGWNVPFGCNPLDFTPTFSLMYAPTEITPSGISPIQYTSRLSPPI